MGVKEIKESFGKSKILNRLNVGIEESTDDIWIGSNAYGVNRVMSGSLFKAVRTKQVVLMVGPEQSFKSSKMALLVSDAQKKGLTPLLVDAEGAWTRKFCENWGVDYNNIITLPKGDRIFVDKLLPYFTEIYQNGIENLCIVIDSIGALELGKMIDDGKKDDVKADQGRLQKDLKRLLKILVAITKENNSIVLMAGHYYGSPSAYGSPDQIGGGKYLKYACDIILALKSDKVYEFPNQKGNERGKIIGREIKTTTLKNREYPEGNESKLKIDFKKGVDELAGLIDLALELKIVEQSGAWYNYNEQKFQGMKNLEQHIKENREPFLNELEEKIQEHGYSKVSDEIMELVENINSDEENESQGD